VRLAGLILIFTMAARAQEAGSGFDLRTTISTASFYSHELTDKPREGAALSGGLRAMLYPTWKIGSHWTVSSAVQLRSRPYSDEEFETQGYGVRGDLMQLNLSYSRFWRNRSLVVRVGQLSTAFGAFLPRYDAADNPLFGMPPSYGYYKGVTVLGLAGAQVDATVGRVDLRAQFVNSSPSNRRSVFDRDQYGNWAGGGGYTIRQGFRVGGSASYGPYLHRQYAFYFPGEANPRDLPAFAYGLDVQWGKGPWNAWGELQHFRMDYRLIPTFTEHAGYAELRRVLNPRWYAATRISYLRASAFQGFQNYEIAAGFRPNRYQLLKFDYRFMQGAAYNGTLGNTAAIELVTSFRAISLARD